MQWIVFYTSLCRFDESALVINLLFASPGQFFKTVTGVVEDVSRSLTVRGCVCFPTITLVWLLQGSNVRIIQPKRRWSCHAHTL